MNRQGVWRLSPAYDISYNHLLATIDGREYKYIIISSAKGRPNMKRPIGCDNPVTSSFGALIFDSERGKNG